MQLEAKISIQGTKDAVWNVITDIENAKETISAIEELEVLERPESGMVGLKWRETRTVFGKSSTETMWITEAEENSHYKTRAESHGCVYVSTFTIREEGDGRCSLSMGFSGQAQTFMAKIMSALMAPLFKGSLRKLLEKDLNDIKAAVEKGG